MEFDDLSFEDVPVAAVKASKAAGAKPAATKPRAPLKDVTAASAATAAVVAAKASAGSKAASAAGGKDGKTIEQIYQKKTQREHILLRPDTYVGSIQKITQPMWVLDSAAGRIISRPVTYVPGLFKIFDEILVNAADNKQRDPKGMTEMRVTIDPASNILSVWNNGKGIPVVVHGEHHVYVPELIFGHLLTSSNYDDDEKKVTGGRNGFGAKLANIFSTEFVVEVADAGRKLLYKQTFSNNMTVKGEPVITPYSGTGDYTCISFCPDLARFGMDSLDDDIVALLSKRVYDMAGVCGRGVKVILNKTVVPVSGFKDYVALYITEDEAPRIWERVSDRWEVCLTLTDGSFSQVSFVNSISTSRGGLHVTYIADQIANAVAAEANKKNKGVDVKPQHVQNYMMLFVNCLIENPAFGSQTKEMLTTRPKDFGSTAELSPAFMKQVLQSGIVERVQSWAKYKATTELQKASGGKKATRFVGIPKLDDANFAGSAKAADCTLILTEGDSAKSLAIAGLSVVGRDYYGVFPLKGKLLNVREASHKQIMANTEIQNIVTILGLQYGHKYESTKGLRYGHLMIMADQDHDGSHIKGLLINVLHHFWPSLLAIPGFLREFITPIVKCVKGRESRTFFTLPEYYEWKMAKMQDAGAAITGATGKAAASAVSADTALRGWSIKYYKGLGTSTAAEAKDYFAAIDEHEIDFAMDDPAETGCDANDLIDLAFSKKRADDRKDWLKAFEVGTHVNYKVERMLMSEFIQKELILFSMADNVRSIPSMVDGLKPAQRKVLFASFKRNLKADIKVAQLAGYVSEHAAYHHGEAALSATIVGMAQNFVGSNNINLLVPSGQFGTRLMGGKDAASARYIFTRLAPITRAIFPAEDDALLHYLDDDGQSIEPQWYMPVIPMVLVNGAEGIGTGWSTFVANYNPRDVIAAMRARISGEAAPELTPWYRGFNGNIERKDANSFVATGIAAVDAAGEKVTITELPVRKWTQDYKQMLVSFITGETAADAEKKGAAGKAKGAKTAAKPKTAAAAKGAGAKPTTAKAAAAAPAAKGKRKAAAKRSAEDGDDGDESMPEDDDDDDFEDEGVESSDDDDDEFEATKKKGKGAAKKEVEPLVPPGEPLVKEFAENHTDTTVSFTVKLTSACAKLVQPCAGAGPEGITPAFRKVFKLDTSLNTSNMHLFDANGVIKRYTSTADIINEFYEIRIAHYEKRKEHLLAKLADEVEKLSNRVRFILAVVNGDLVVSNRKKAELLAELHDAGYKGFDAGTSAETMEDADDDDAVGIAKAGKDVNIALLSKRYHYLLSMPLWSLTMEKVAALRAELADKDAELARLRATMPAEMWITDLDRLEEALDAFEVDVAQTRAQEAAARKAFARGTKGGASKSRGAARPAKARKRTYDDDDSDEDMFDDDDDEDFEVRPKKTAPKPTAVAKPVPAAKPAATAKAAVPASRAIPASTTVPIATAPQVAAARVSALTSAPIPAVPKTTTSISMELDDLDFDLGISTLSLADRVAAKITPASTTTAPAAAAATKPLAKAASKAGSTKTGAAAHTAAPAATAKPAAPAPAEAARPRRAASKATYVDDGSDDDVDLFDEEADEDFDASEGEQRKKTKSKAPPAAAKATAPAVKAVKRNKSDEMSGASVPVAIDLASPVRRSPQAKKPKAAAKAAGAKPRKLAAALETAAKPSAGVEPAREAKPRRAAAAAALKKCAEFSDEEDDEAEWDASDDSEF